MARPPIWFSPPRDRPLTRAVVPSLHPRQDPPMLMRPLLPLAAAVALAAPTVQAQQPTLTFSDGVIGSQVDYQTAGPPGKLAALLISLNAGPIPVAIIDPTTTGILEVGLDLLSLLQVVPAGVPVTFPLPNAPALVGQTLHAQFLTLPGATGLVDDLSNPTRFVMGLPGSVNATLQPNVIARQGHSSTTTIGGDSAIILGGIVTDALGVSTAQISGERYVPETQSFELLPNAMLAPRTVHTATLLDDGRILIAGGADINDNVLASCEIFDPATGTSTAVASMSTARTQHSATKLLDGRVLVIGGSALFDLDDPIGSLGEAKATSEIYDPNTNSWSPGPSLPQPTIGHTATLLGSGNVLVAGGVRVAFVFGAPIPSISDTCRLYVTGSNSYATVPSIPGPRVYHGATALPDGSAVVFGGADGSFITLTFSPLGSSYRYNEGTNSWAAQGNMVVPRAYVESSLRPATGEVVAAGGLVSVDVTTGQGTPTKVIETYDPGTGVWSSFATMSSERNIVRATSVDNGVRMLITGGAFISATTEELSSDAELLIF